MFMFQSLKFLPPHILFFEGETLGVLFFAVAGIFWMLIPFVKLQNGSINESKFFTYFGLATLAFMLGMTILGYLV